MMLFIVMMIQKYRLFLVIGPLENKSMCFALRIREDKNKNMYEVIVETYCMSVRDYAACNAVRNLFDSCYEDKMDAVKAYDDQYEKYYKEHKYDSYCYKHDDIFEIVEKKSAGYNVVVRGRIFIKGEADK